MFFNIFYDAALVVISFLALPKLLYQMLFHNKYRNSLMQRFGLGYPKIHKGYRNLIWVHAVSVGETKAVSTIVKRIKKNNPELIFVVSSVTETGYAEAKRSMPEAEWHVFLPFDFSWIVKPIIRQIRPDIVILCESDFWYNFLRACKQLGSTIYLVNGKLSENSQQRFKRFSYLSSRLFAQIDKFCVQSPHYQKRFLDLGINKEKIIITGNIKFDCRHKDLNPEEASSWKTKMGIPGNALVLVAGSTHDPEEKMLLETLQKVWKKIPNLTLILVPRHPERFDEVANLLKKMEIAFHRYSQTNLNEKKHRVILVDAMGVLRHCYKLADAALVAGSYTPKVGGHNIIEPSQYGVPVIYGPYMHSQPELVELMQRYGAGVQADQKSLETILITLFTDHSERKSIGKKGITLTNDLQGPAEATFLEIDKCINDRSQKREQKGLS